MRAVALSVSTTRKRIGDRLLEAGLITQDQLDQALQQQQDTSQPLGEVVVGLGLVDEDAVTRVLGEHLHAPVMNLRHEMVEEDAATLIPEEYARRHLVLPVSFADGQLRVAMADPGDLSRLNDLRVMTGHPVQPYLANRSEILHSIQQAYTARPRIQEMARSFEAVRAPGRGGVQELSQVTADSPVVEIVNLLLAQAMRDRASDVHIEPQEDRLRVRFRVDGVLQEAAHLPTALAGPLASRIKIMADLNIVERHRSQDGQVSVSIDGRDLDVRVATMETIWGEKLVLRLLDRSRSLITLQQLGFSPQSHRVFTEHLHSPYGMIVVAGPTGSGKTTSLYAALHELNPQEKNITTIEDPVEYQFPDINQVQINKVAGITFASGLRSVLRQDPDIILVGEVRDRETAEAAVQAALTGHLVLCSIHATDAVGALHRIMDMGVEGFLIASSVTAVVAQRLVRKVCDSCRQAHATTLEEREFGLSLGAEAPPEMIAGQGCSRCGLTGYLDRIGVFELLVLDDALKRMVVEGAGHHQMQQAAIQGGMVTMREDAWHKARAGMTTIAEILRSVYSTS
ncbi:MAG: GspE/PulE family protein [Candidatus Dormibacteria bacterium]